MQNMEDSCIIKLVGVKWQDGHPKLLHLDMSVSHRIQCESSSPGVCKDINLHQAPLQAVPRLTRTQPTDLSVSVSLPLRRRVAICSRLM